MDALFSTFAPLRSNQSKYKGMGIEEGLALIHPGVYVFLLRNCCNRNALFTHLLIFSCILLVMMIHVRLVRLVMCLDHPDHPDLRVHYPSIFLPPHQQKNKNFSKISQKWCTQPRLTHCFDAHYSCLNQNFGHLLFSDVIWLSITKTIIADLESVPKFFKLDLVFFVFIASMIMKLHLID